MKHEIIRKLYTDFEAIARAERDVEFWLARELQFLLGYLTWESFVRVVEKAKTACRNSEQPVENHFRDVTKMVDIGSGARREVEDVALTRYACYLVAQNGDPRKDPIAFAQTYFAVQTRMQEVIEKRLDEIDRLNARGKLSESENTLSGVIFERLGDGDGVARVRSRGDQALFGGFTTHEMKQRLSVPTKRPLADFLPTITIKAKDFANEITNFNIKRDDLRTEPVITSEHVKNNQDVRNLLKDRGIKPEELPREEDIKKLERRVKADERKLPKTLPGKSVPPVSDA